MPRRVIPLLVFLAVAPCIGVRAEDGAPEAPQEPYISGPPMTAMAGGVLRRSQLVVKGRVLEARTVRTRGGVQIATIAADRVLKGARAVAASGVGDGRGRLTVLVQGPRPTDDPNMPSVPYLEAHPERPYVFFLQKPEEGVAWRLLTVFSGDGILGLEKTQVLQGHISLAAIPDPDARGRRTLAFLLEGQTSQGTWTRVHAARELNHLFAVRPCVFDGSAIRKLEAIVQKVKLPAQRKWLLKILEALECAPPVPEPLKEAPGVAELRKAVHDAEDEDGKVEVLRRALESSGARGLAVVLRVLQGEAPAIRVRVVDLLAAGGWREVLVPIRSLYAQEESPEVQRAIVRAVGRLGRGAEVPWLEARARSLRVQREALFGLARIRTPNARQALERARERLRAEDAGDADVKALVDYLLSPAFEAVEGSRHRGPR